MPIFSSFQAYAHWHNCVICCPVLKNVSLEDTRVQVSFDHDKHLEEKSRRERVGREAELRLSLFVP